MTRRTLSRGTLGALVVFAATAIGALCTLRARKAARAPVLDVAPPLVAPPLGTARIDQPGTWWRDHGFFLLTSPVRPPTSRDATTRIVEYLRIPEGGHISGRWVGDPPHASLRFPAGTVADRVEYDGSGDLDEGPQIGWRVLDVRGTTLGDGGQVFHVYRPTGAAPSDPLVGLTWPSGDDDAQTRATRTLGAMMEQGTILGPSSDAARRASAARLRSINGCASCHVPDRAPRVRDPGVVHRGTDADGFFQPSTSFDDRAPLETYRPRNANLGDRFMRFVCGDDPSPAHVDAEGRVTCARGDVPVGVLDIRAALHERDAHARALCASRRYLYDRLDEDGRRTFARAMAMCDPGLGSPPSLKKDER